VQASPARLILQADPSIDANERDVIALRAKGTYRFFGFISGAVRVQGADRKRPVEGVDDLMNSLSEQRGLRVTAVDGVKVDGRRTVVFDVANVGQQPAALLYYAKTEGHYYLNPSVTVRVHWLEVKRSPRDHHPGEPTSTFSAFLDCVQPVLRSLTFGPQLPEAGGRSARRIKEFFLGAGDTFRLLRGPIPLAGSPGG
jgi:hypothetical protein